MAKSRSRLIAIGGGELKEAPEPLEAIRRYFRYRRNGRMVVMTVATNQPRSAATKYLALFKNIGIKHVDVVDVSQREDSFTPESIKKIEKADGMYFTGGDQLNITSLIGGSPMFDILHHQYKRGVLIAGTSAGAAMMSASMIISGESDAAPRVGGVEIAPGMNLVEGVIIDTHFSQRGRHGRLLTAVAHFPQLLGIGIDERTAAIFDDGEFKVAGEGAVTVFDGSKMRHTDLPYRRGDETVAMFGASVHVLPTGYMFRLETREPIAPELTKIAIEGNV
jgi:cyanophycinase